MVSINIKSNLVLLLLMAIQTKASKPKQAIKKKPPVWQKHLKPCDSKYLDQP